MEKDFKLEKAGKRMPYIMPEGFMKDLEEDVMRGIGQTKPAAVPQRRGARFATLRIFVAAAAVATLFVVCLNTMPAHRDGGYADVEKAFDNLSYDDQAFMLETCSNDVFMPQADSPEY